MSKTRLRLDDPVQAQYLRALNTPAAVFEVNADMCVHVHAYRHRSDPCPLYLDCHRPELYPISRSLSLPRPRPPVASSPSAPPWGSWRRRPRPTRRLTCTFTASAKASAGSVVRGGVGDTCTRTCTHACMSIFAHVVPPTPIDHQHTPNPCNRRGQRRRPGGGLLRHPRVLLKPEDALQQGRR